MSVRGGVVGLVAVVGIYGSLLAQGAQPRAVLVELFTSEGCSSCPPADALLAKVNGRVTNANQLIVGVSEHVTYWNYLGWSDPFSLDSVTERQNHYGNVFRLDSVYTPQMVVNGETQVLGSDESELRKALLAQKPSGVEVRIDSLAADAKGIGVGFSVMGAVPTAGVDVYAIVADDRRSTSVVRGENSGRTLSHVAVARSLVKVATVKAAGMMTVQVPEVGKGDTGQHLVLFLQARGMGRVLAVDERALVR